jgi:hypothetical protein
MSRVPSKYPTKAEITRAIDAVTKAGVAIEAVEVRPDGTIRVLAAGSKPVELSPDDELREWRRRKCKT